MNERIGRLLGYFIVGCFSFMFAYLAMGFLAWDWNVVNWSETRRGVVGAWTLIFFSLWFFETRK